MEGDALELFLQFPGFLGLVVVGGDGTAVCRSDPRLRGHKLADSLYN